MVGMWQASIASTWRSIAVANEYAAKSKLDGVLAGVPHAYDFMQYAYLQLGQDAKAKALIDESATIKKVVGPHLAGHGRGRRAGALLARASGLEGRGAAPAAGTSPFPPAEAITHFARAMGAARSGDVAAAQADIAS